MATGTLTGQTIANTYKALLKITGTTAGGETLHATTQKVIEDGDGNPFPFSAAQDAILMTGTSRIEFNEAGEYISGDGTDLTITSGNDIVLALGATGSVYHTGDGGTSNTIYGKNAGDALDSGGNYNVFLGEEAGSAMVTGTNNIAIGYGAFDAADAGEDDNIAIGLDALGDANHASTVRNIAIGSGAMNYISGIQGANIDNTFIGHDAGGGQWDSAVSAYNVGIGNYAMDAGMNGALGNTAVGYASLSGLTSGDGNVAIGQNAAFATTNSHGNVAIGHDAMKLCNVSDGYNVAIGHGVMDAGTGGYYNICIGKDTGAAFANANVGTCVLIGHEAGDAINSSDADGTVSIGYQALSALASGIGNVAIGANALDAAATSDYNTAVGHQALSGVNIDGASGSTAVGYKAGIAITDATYSTAIGYQALLAEDQGDKTTAIGAAAFENQNNGVGDTGNTGVGYAVGYRNVTGTNNTYIGYQAGFGTSGGAVSNSNNTAVGKDALLAITDGGYNTCIGDRAGDAITDGAQNVFIGAGAGTNDINFTTGDSCVVIGHNADVHNADAQNEIAIGQDCSGVDSNSVTLGNAAVTAVYMASDSGASVFAASYMASRTSEAGIGATPADENSGEFGPGYINLSRDDTSTVKQILFGKNGSEVGSVSSDGSNTAFNTSSDYRLKENETAIPDGISRLSALKPYRFNWKSENDADNKPTRTVDGFFAHEVATVIPEAVIGEKDATNDDGGISIQSMDYSKVVPLLVAAVQELSAKVKALEDA